MPSARSTRYAKCRQPRMTRSSAAHRRYMSAVASTGEARSRAIRERESARGEALVSPRSCVYLPRHPSADRCLSSRAPLYTPSPVLQDVAAAATLTLPRPARSTPRAREIAHPREIFLSARTTRDENYGAYRARWEYFSATAEGWWTWVRRKLGEFLLRPTWQVRLSVWFFSARGACSGICHARRLSGSGVYLLLVDRFPIAAHKSIQMTFWYISTDSQARNNHVTIKSILISKSWVSKWLFTFIFPAFAHWEKDLLIIKIFIS